MNIVFIVIMMIKQSHAFAVRAPAASSSTSKPPTQKHYIYTPPCQPATASVSGNILRTNPCSSPCLVVVNGYANTTGLCSTWSPNAFWDGHSCVCRCELLNGHFNASSCIINGTVEVRAYNKSAHSLYTAPIQCGTWLGVRDSASSSSWYQSECSAILENKLETGDANVSACGVDRYTQGCRFLATNQRWVPECREASNLTECGVYVPCLDRNPCKLGPDIHSNLDPKYFSCNTSRYLALNVSATADDCHGWTDEAFLLDGNCVTSCGRLENQCVVGGQAVPPCNGGGGICSVPMSPYTFTGYRNGFYGLSRANGSGCMVTVRATCSVLCPEGLNITAFQPDEQLPWCIGDPSLDCVIEVPCKRQCKRAVLGISEAIYTLFNVYDCGWFTGRDCLIIVIWVISLCFMLTVMNEHGDMSACRWLCIFVLGMIVFGLLSCVWEIMLGLALLYMLCHGSYVLSEQKYTRL